MGTSDDQIIDAPVTEDTGDGTQSLDEFIAGHMRFCTALFDLDRRTERTDFNPNGNESSDSSRPVPSVEMEWQEVLVRVSLFPTLLTHPSDIC